MSFKCVRWCLVAGAADVCAHFYKVIKCSISLSIISALSTTCSALPLSHFVYSFFFFSFILPFSSALFCSILFFTIRLRHFLLYFATYLSPFFASRTCHSAQFVALNASNASLCKIFSIFKKLLCERNFIFMTFFCSYLHSFVVHHNHCTERYSVYRLYSVHRLYNIHRSTFTVHILSHTFVRSTYKKQIKLLKRDILIACIDDILTFSAPIMTLGLFSPSIYFLLSLTLTQLLLENGFFKSKEKKQTIFAFCSSLSHKLEFHAHIAYIKRKRKRKREKEIERFRLASSVSDNQERKAL